MLCLQLWYSGCSHSAVSIYRKQNISKLNYEISVVQEIHISRLELQIYGLLNLLFLFLKYIFGIWDWSVANSSRDHVIQISIRHIHFSNYEKLNFFVETFTLLLNTYFPVTVMSVHYGFFCLILTWPKLTVLLSVAGCSSIFRYRQARTLFLELSFQRIWTVEL